MECMEAVGSKISLSEEFFRCETENEADGIQFPRALSSQQN